jgi:hypothetical protein
MPEGSGEEVIPPVVTFTSGAELLRRLGVVETMTREGVRKISKDDPNWPFGPDRPHQYGKVANAQTMDTEVFLAFFRARTTKKRGPDKQPRRRRADPAPSSEDPS